MTIRTIRKESRSIPTIEGAGVHLKRAFGFRDPALYDPFLLLDDFRSDEPRLYLKGFPWHPHRGIETITYVLRGDVEHGDSLGNQGVISSGDVQWMTAGRGIIHQEMPKGDPAGAMYGFQLWANLPASQKMMDPRYRDVKRQDIPEVTLENGARIKVICGRVDGIAGPVRDIVIDPEYLDVAVPAQARFTHATPPGYTALAYVIEGRGDFSGVDDLPVVANSANGTLIHWNDGDSIAVATGSEPVRFLLMSGRPIGEPIAWYGPIVMNTQQELEQAFAELNRGTFVKRREQ